MGAVDAYLAKLPADRRTALARVRDVVNASLPAGYEEGIQYGGITWFVPTSRLAETYNGQPLALATLASQKSHMALYLMSIYGDTKLRAWFVAAYARAGKKADLGSESWSRASADKIASPNPSRPGTNSTRPCVARATARVGDWSTSRPP